MIDLSKLGITPEPYKLTIYDHGGSRMYREVGNDRDLIMDTYGPEANARLYSAAPEMLDALIEVVIEYEFVKGIDVFDPTIEKCRDAIGAAGGKAWAEIKALLS